MEPLTGEELQMAATNATESAAGGDQWGPGDIKLFSSVAFERIAEMLNAVESGEQWPQEMQHSSAAFMAKDEEDKLNPLAYRVLLMLPSIYRLWGRTRLGHLQPWIAQWATPEMFVGIEGQGAEEAAYSTALLLEHCRVTGEDFSGGPQMSSNSSIKCNVRCCTRS